MTMKRRIDGIVYLMRDDRSVAALRKLHSDFEVKYGKMDFHRWLVTRGKVYVRIRKQADNAIRVR